MAYDYLKKFLDTAQILENTKSSTIQRESKNWYELLDNIGDSIKTLYQFHTFLINNHSYFKDKPYEKQLCSFYMDMFISKIKHTFFTECPQVPIEELSKNKASSIYINGLKLFENIDESTVQKTLFLFYYKIFLFYDFVYDKDTKKGKFTKFKIDKDKVNKTIELLKDIEMTSIKKFRESLSKIIPKTINKQLDFGLENEKSPYEIYNIYLKNDYEMEPLSYFTIFKIWKISKFLQDKFEESNRDDFKSFEEVFLKETKRYIEQSIKIINTSYEYDSSDIFSKETYSLDKEYMKDIVYKYIHQKEKYLVNKEIKQIEVNIETEEFEINIEDLKNTIENHILKDNNLETWKFNKVFDGAKKEELLNLSYAFYSLVQDKDNTFIGLYKSGALLAHILNICSGLKDNVYLFTTFPYVAIHPRSFDIRKESKNFIIVDENYKTGFTSLIAKEYITRRKEHKLDIFSLVVNSDYKQIESNNIRAVGSIRNKKLDIFDTVGSVFAMDIEKFCLYIKENYEKYTEENFVKDFITIKSDNIMEYDITRVLSSSVVLFSIAYKFLSSLDKTKNEVFFQSPTDSSRLIAEAIAFLSKILNYEYKFYFKCKADLENLQKIFIDLSIDSGFTMEYSTKRDLGNSISYDKIFVIGKLSDDNNIDKVEYLFKREDNNA
ncbi:hypothetical protein [Aliarcobacter butzleri]|uniref:hypothetical protein n=1 Tax=Aliarcobacter butzleri TaxID=28197 RepID=UPI0021B41D9C|nr:hypothetical protein [Aliarcobacter butzleri]